MKERGGIYRELIQLSGLNRIGRNSMDESIQIAYDLKHQIECLPEHIRRNVFVDGSETEHDMLARIAIVVHALETHQTDIK
jgi:hypothetical protein|tara:strand:- start:606 stop:848 length:243 start_codon:yes stop_codon:yes gene_type:complete